MIDDDHRLRFEKKGFVLKGMKMFSCPKAVAEEHYEDLSAKPFFGTCCAFPKSRHTVLPKLVTVVLPLVEYTAVIERKCTTYSTSALFGPSTPDCLLIHITKYTHTRPTRD